MKNYKAMYIHDVVRRLPKEQREDVSKELESLIDDMMESDVSLEEVLQELGHPSELAAKYREKPRYLISPDVFDSYLSTLKLVLPILAVAGIVLGAIEKLAEIYLNHLVWVDSLKSGVMVYGKMIGAAIEGGVNFIFYGAVWITIIYIFIDYKQNKKKKKSWQIKDLPEIPNEKLKKISRTETIIGIILSFFFMGLFLVLLETNGLAWIKLNTNAEIILIFNSEVLRQFLPLFYVVFASSILIAIAKIVLPYWNFYLATAVLIQKAVLLCLTILVLNTSGLITLEFIEFLAKYLPSHTSVNELIHMVKYGFIAIISIGSMVEITLNYYRAYRNYMIKKS